MPRLYWAKDWAKLLMNATLLGADCLPRGGVVTVEAGADPPGAVLPYPRRRASMPASPRKSTAPCKGEALNVDARHVQPFLTHKLSRTVNAALTITPLEGAVEIVGGQHQRGLPGKRNLYPDPP